MCPILSYPNIATLTSVYPHGKKCSQYNHYTRKNVAKRPPCGKKVHNIVII